MDYAETVDEEIERSILNIITVRASGVYINIRKMSPEALLFGEKMKYVILLDGGFLKPKYSTVFGHEPSATGGFHAFATTIRGYNDPTAILSCGYDYILLPCGSDSLDQYLEQSLTLPLPSFAPNMARLAALKRMDYFAVREGRLTCHGWKLRKSGIGKAAADLTDSILRRYSTKGR